jgi:hypothetical protein
MQASQKAVFTKDSDVEVLLIGSLLWVLTMLLPMLCQQHDVSHSYLPTTAAAKGCRARQLQTAVKHSRVFNTRQPCCGAAQTQRPSLAKTGKLLDQAGPSASTNRPCAKKHDAVA